MYPERRGPELVPQRKQIEIRAYAAGAVARSTREILEHIGLENDRPAALEVQNTAALPVAQAPVDSLACRANHLRKITLRQRKLELLIAAAARLSGAQKRLGETRRQL